MKDEVGIVKRCLLLTADLPGSSSWFCFPCFSPGCNFSLLFGACGEGREERRGEEEVVETEELWVAFRVHLFFCLWYYGGGS